MWYCLVARGVLGGILAGHASFELSGAPDDMARSIFWVVTRGPSATKKFREKRLAQWSSWAQDLSQKEEALKGSMNPGVRRVLRRKRVLLLKKILKQVGFPNPDLLALYLVKGFPITGEVPVTGAFPARRTPASCSVGDLWADARTSRSDALSSLGPSRDKFIDAEVTRITGEELKEDWLEGPFL